MATGLSLPHALRDIKRYFEILRVLVKHGFGDLVQELKLESLLDKGMALVRSKDEKSALVEIPRPVRIRQVLEELGTTFIKLGQVLSMRPDLVPAEWANEFRKLQSRCTEVPFKEIERRINAEFPKKARKIFRKIDPVPLAAASIAQVHRATLRKGTPILIKVLRPGVEDRVEADIAILRTLAELTETHFSNLGYSPRALVNEFDREIHRELDFAHEGRAAERFRSIFAEDEAIVFPKIFWEATTSRVLAEEEIKGTLLSDPAAHKLPLVDRQALVANGTRAVLCQCLEAGYFHADPHPGNLFALSAGRIAFVDCGMVGQLDTETMGQLAELTAGVVAGDAERVARVVGSLTDAGPEKTEARAFKADIRELVSHFEHTSLGRLDIGELLQQFFDVLRRHSLRCPADLVLLIKALSTIQLVGKEFDPSFDFVGYAAPYIEKLIKRHYSISAIRKRVEKSFLGYAELVEHFPGDVQQIMKQLRTNKVSINVEHRGLQRLTSTIEHASRNISFSMIIAAMLIGSSILVLSDRNQTTAGVSTLGLIGFGIACFMLVLRFVASRRSRG